MYSYSSQFHNCCNNNSNNNNNDSDNDNISNNNIHILSTDYIVNAVHLVESCWK